MRPTWKADILTGLKFLAVYLLVTSAGLSVMLIRTTNPWQERRRQQQLDQDTISEFEVIVRAWFTLSDETM